MWTSREYSALLSNWFTLDTTLPALSGSLEFAVADMDGDGDFDMLVNGRDANTYNNEIQYYQNIGTPSSPSFTSPVNTFFNITPPTNGLLGFPELADIDTDGDIDLLYSQFNLLHFNEFIRVV